VWRRFEEQRESSGFARAIVRPDAAPLGVRLIQEGIGSLRGAIGTPDQVADLVRRYDAVGVDQIIFILQAGSNRHEHICESLELFAAEVMPEFVEGREEREALKVDRLSGAVEAALARREPARKLAGPYEIDEEAELSTARPVGGAVRSDDLRGALTAAARRGATKLLARMVDGASDEQVERRFSSGVALRAIFAGMARSFEPDQAAGFRGRLVYELARPATGRPPARWTIEVLDGGATARPGASDGAALIVRFTLSDFVRIAAGAIDPAEPLLADRASFEGDFALAARLPEMFGAPSPY
jgi:hypothetical protein